jgi:Na+-translocating ferredoxin:NAD+ oxidoreductase RnfG subunit
MANIEINDSTPAKKKTVSFNLPNVRRFKLKNVLLALAVIALILMAYGYVHTKHQLNEAKNPSTAGKTEIQQIINQISKSVALPNNETPTLATVNDVGKLKNQNFFKNAQNGDKVLIYSKSGQAVLYRPSTKQVIEYAPINLNGQ